MTNLRIGLGYDLHRTAQGRPLILANIQIPHEAVAAFCQRHGIARLAFFGSAVRDDFRPESDIDVLVDFAPGTRVGLLGLAAMEQELGVLLGRRVDLNTLGFLSPYIRDRVLAEAVTEYDAA